MRNAAGEAFTRQLSPSELEVWSHGDRLIPGDVDAWRSANRAEITAQAEFDQELEWNMELDRREREAELEAEAEP